MRREKSLFIVEGRRELEHCLQAGYTVKTLFVCPDIISAPDLEHIIDLISPLRDSSRRGNGIAENRFVTEIYETDKKTESTTIATARSDRRGPDCNIIELPAALYNKVAYRGGTEGVIAEVKMKELSLDNLKISQNPLVIVLEAVEKPGNLGAVLRSADACGADAVIVCDPLTDIWNPNLIRSSMGAIFSTQIAVSNSEETISWLKSKDIRILTAQLQNAKWYYDTPMTEGTAIVMGTESTGLTQIWRDAADAHIKIPMLGQLDSLNVSVSAAILLYEAVRQRNSANDDRTNVR